MKLLPIAALALFAATPALATPSFLVDFESNWQYGAAIDNTYSALGVSFTNVLGFSNGDGLGSLPNGDYYANSPSPLGVAFAQLDGVSNVSAYMNVAAGVEGALSFFYSSPVAVTGAIKAYSGLNGTGTLLGIIDLAANSDNYDAWTQVNLSFGGTAHSFDLTGTANAVALDNISAVPEPGSYALVLAGLGLLGLSARRKRA